MLIKFPSTDYGFVNHIIKNFSYVDMSVTLF